MDILTGRKILEIVKSPFNGTITVVRELAWGTNIQVGGLPQSGGLAKTIWQKSLRSVKGMRSEIKTVLVLGFAGGGISEICRKYWPDSKVYGVDIDPAMVEMGRKYLGWESNEVRVWIDDASKFVNSLIQKGVPSGKVAEGSMATKTKVPKTYDLVCVDMYVGSTIPKQFDTVEFAKKVKKLIKPDGIAVFNRLYGSHDTGHAEKFKEKLDTVFPRVKIVYPDANIMFLCER